MKFVMPHLIRGSDALVWILTGAFVAIGLLLVWFVYRLSRRTDEGGVAGDGERETTPLHAFASQGDLVNLEAELRSAGTHEHRDSQGYTPLMAAAMSPQAGVDVVRCLLEHGADVNAVSSPPAPLAESRAAMDAAGLDTSFLDQASETPAGASVLCLAAEHAALPKIKLLIEKGADVTWVNDNGYSVLLMALFRKVETTNDERRAILEVLVDAGALLDCESSYGESVLSVAARTADIDLVKFFLGRGADPSVLRWNDVFHTIAFGTAEELAALLKNAPPLNEVDGWGRTPFLFAVHCGRLEMARQLLEHGADRDATGRAGSTAMAYAIEGNHAETLRWLLTNGWDVQRPVDQFHASPLRHAVQHDHAECVRLLIEAGADIYDEDEYGFDLLHEAVSPAVIWVLHDAGLAMDRVPSEQRVRLLPVNDGQPFAVSAADYQDFHARRFGRSNPEEMGNAFWNEMVRSRCSGYAAREKAGGQNYEPPYDRPVWCFARFGQSLTRLPSGQFVEIGGEHEDFYDPDFCIYNDVVVHDGRGGFRIFGYPQEIFPPTDFHTATWLDGALYIIGSLGYLDARRPGETPVFRLNCETWRMEPVPSCGQVPGWIHSHQARAESDGTILIWGGKIWDGQDLVDNQETFCFDPRTGQWTEKRPTSLVRKA
jgi:ankyrin repeat protein